MQAELFLTVDTQIINFKQPPKYLDKVNRNN